MKPIILLLACSSILAGCNHVERGLGSDKEGQKSLRDFPAETSVTNLTKTLFIPTLEEGIKPGDNIIYTPTFLLAWNALQDETGRFTQVPANNQQLNFVNRSLSYKNALADNEYNKTIKVSERKITVRTAFNKSLPFKVPLDSQAGFKFMGTTVKAFGMRHYDWAMAEQISILYYKNDDEFIIRLAPEDHNNEIIIAKGLDSGSDLITLQSSINQGIERGRTDQQQEENLWRYRLKSIDEVIIPVLRFNIGANYASIENQHVATADQTYFIEKAYQRTAFILDEYGAKVESVAEVAAAAAAAPVGPAKRPTPKHFLLNKPFAVILKKVNSTNPYFMMKVENDELMIRR